jgi:putative transposase
MRKQKPIIRSDNGPRLIGNLFEEVCTELNIEHERIPKTGKMPVLLKTPNLNAHIESFNAIL